MSTSGIDVLTDQASAPVSHGSNVQLSLDSSPAALAVPRVIVVCPSCRATLRVRQIYIGNPVQCKHCSEIFTVRGAEDRQSVAIGGSVPNAAGKSVRAAAAGAAILDQLADFLARHHELQSAHDQLQAECRELRADRDVETVKLQDGDLTAVR